MRTGIEHLQHLGSNNTSYVTTYDKTLLEKIPVNKMKQGALTVKLNCLEFTSLCPKTNQPDFGSIDIVYIPNNSLVESKSLKLYLFSFRNHGEFHEDCITRIAEDIFQLIEPKYIKVTGNFNARGGISIVPVAEIEEL